MFAKKRKINLLIGILYLFGMLFAQMSGYACAQGPYDGLATSLLEKNYSLYQAGKAVDGQWGNFGSYDAYVLKQAGVDVGAWVYGGSSFKDGVINQIDITIAAESGVKKTSQRVAQDYLAAQGIGETAKSAELLAILQARQTVSGNVYFDNNAFSDIAALEMLGRAGDIDQINQAGAIAYILGKQEAGAWPPAADWGPDFMTTAQAVRVLKYLDPQEQQAAITTAISSGCDWLRSKQQSDGSFLGNVWEDPVTDTAEVITTLKLLGIDPISWSTGGKTAMDYLLASGSQENISSNTWALDACLKLGATVNSNPGSGGETGTETPDTITVSAKVVGKNGEVLFGPAQVSLSRGQNYGLTALGALNSTGLSWSFSSQFDTLVETIAGQKNEGMSGWMFKINDHAPMLPARDAVLAQGDSIIWWYSSDADSLDNSTAGFSQNTQEIKYALDKYKADFGRLGANTLLVSIEQRMSPAQLELLQKELDSNKVVLKDIEVGMTEALLADERQEVTLYIPEKALNENKKLSVQEMASVSRPGQYAHKIISSLFEFEPSGTVFAKPVTISLKVPIGADIDINRLTPAWYDENTNKWVAISGIIDLKDNRVVFQTDHFTDFALLELPARSSFADLEGVDGARDAIEILAGNGVIKGTGSGFEPKRSINRAEFAQLLVKALEIEPESDKTASFRDVNKTDWFAPAVETVSATGVFAGFADQNFRPAQALSRYDIAAIMLKIANNNEQMADYKLNCTDRDKVPGQDLDGVKYLLGCKLLNTEADGAFHGEKPLSRAEAALLIYKYLNMQ